MRASFLGGGGVLPLSSQSVLSNRFECISKFHAQDVRVHEEEGERSLAAHCRAVLPDRSQCRRTSALLRAGVSVDSVAGQTKRAQFLSAVQY